MLENIFFNKKEQMFKKELLFKEVFDNPQYFQKEKYGLKATIVELFPYDYIDIVNMYKPEHKTSPEKLEKLKKAYDSNIKVDIPYLKFASRDELFKDFGQEGYNRAYTSTMIDKKTIPVAILYRENDNSLPNQIKDAIKISEMKIQAFIYGYLSSDNTEVAISNDDFRKLITSNRKLLDSFCESIKFEFVDSIYNSFELGVSSKNKKENLPFYLEYEIEKTKYLNSLTFINKKDKDELIIGYIGGANETLSIENFREKVDYKNIDLLTKELDNKSVTAIKYDYLGLENNVKNHSLRRNK